MSIRQARILPLVAALAAATMLAAACSSSSSATSESSGSTAAASTAASGDASAAAPSEIRIAYQAIPNGDLVVKGSKWLEEAFPNTTITWTKFESGGDVNTAVIAGAVDIGLAGSSPVVRGLSEPNNIPYSIPWIFDVIGDAESLVASSASGVTDVAGLKGKKIGTPFASTSHYSLLAALQQAGLTEADVTIVDLEPPDILAAWTRGDIDAAYVWSPTLDELKKSGAAVLATSSELAAAGFPTFDLAVVTNKFKDAYPGAVQEWLRQQNRAVELIKSDPAGAASVIAGELSITPEEVQNQLKGLQFLGQEEQQSAEFLGTPTAPGAFGASLLSAAEFQKAQGKIDEVPSLQTLQAAIDTANLSSAFSG